MKTLIPERAAELPPRERILATAHRLFYREGIRATGIDRIIAESGVSKVTFYRYFPSKNELILAYLEQRHGLWQAWFREALTRHAAVGPAALALALGEWFASEDFRGCAFINGAGEMPADPAVAESARRHKAAMRDAIAESLAGHADQAELAAMLSLAADGAIVRAQLDGSAETALQTLAALIARLTG
ncbi:TetR/AcrR family transcriptional regulator [Chromobacterium alticapitis]|uniref:TetR family transcriptional regulator n=1 Tax=Chromobacterium alticapitis TaxID=2073169 RepID=A0A2S5DCN6_9NEIS|nr:TetR/AcrR family transcriptional regulator [Chromobacterium alticapitis]POZ60814.1 TetR family transcriptional regulator [Chromobacterium alticapitis]